MIRLVLTAATAMSLAGAAQAQTVDQRHADQQARITQGVESGQLTGREARRDERQQGRIDATEARMRARNGGSLNYAQRARLQARESRASAHIYRTKHNGRAY